MSQSVRYENCLFDGGETPLKESRDIEAISSTFDWKYPLWYMDGLRLEDCNLTEHARAGLWYVDDLDIKGGLFKAPKLIRRCNHVRIEGTRMEDAEEAVWWCSDVKIKNLHVEGESCKYFGMKCHDMEIDNLTLLGRYSFEDCYNITIRNSKMVGRDCFWNCHDIVIENCQIEGDYFGWNSRNITMRNCVIKSHQGLCYMDNLVMENCTVLEGSDLIFELCSDVKADLKGYADSIKNPISGSIKIEKVGEVIFDNPKVDKKDTELMIG